jgi:hypothetical protein
MSSLSRRAFQQQALGSLLTYSLLETLFSGDVFAEEVKPLAARWLADINMLSSDLKGKKLEQVEWQKKIEELFAAVELPELMKFIDFEKLKTFVKPKERGEQALRANLPKVEGLPTELVFGHQVFALTKGRSVPPHGHDNMATAFLILQGSFQGRHYDRLEDEPQHMIVTPTLDRKFGPGEYSTVSEFKDNVHWFEALSDEAFIFNIHVMGLHEGRSQRLYIDPNGEKLPGNRIRAPKIDHARANELYG